MDLEHARGDAVDEVAVVGDEQDGAGVVLERVGERLDGAHVEVVGGLVEQQEVGVADEQREQAQAAALAAREHARRVFSTSSAVELEAAEQAARDLLVVADQRQHRLQRGRRLLELAALLREVGEAHVVAEVATPSARLRRPAMVSTRVVLPEPLAPSRATFSPRSSTTSTSRTSARAAASPAEPTVTRRRLQLEHDARRRLRLRQPQLEARASRLRRLHVALDALDLRELGLGLLGLVLLGVEAVVEALQLLDLLVVLLVLAGGDLVGGGALAQVGGEVAAVVALDVLVLHGEHARPDPLQQAAVVGHEHEGARVVEQEPLEPLDGVDVEVVGRLVEQQQVGVGEQGARQGHARELAAGESRGGRARACRRAGRGPRARRRGRSR